jgi:hypothetical protein
MVDKDYYAYGNYLIFNNVISYGNNLGGLPEWMGTAWVGGSWGSTTPHVIDAWQAYEHTGDAGFIDNVYNNQFKPLHYQKNLAGHWGCDFEAAQCLHDMAELTGDTIDPDYWLTLVPSNVENWLDSRWEVNGVENFFAAYPAAPLGWGGFGYLRNEYPGAEGGFPDLWAAQMYEDWGMNDVNGFFDDVPMSVRALKDKPAEYEPFWATPDTAYWAQYGMFKQHIGLNAAVIATAHLKSYNYHQDWDMPVAPEAWDSDNEIWGDAYSNFNAGKILLILEGLCGLEYSVPDSTFTISDTMPTEWSYMNIMVPIGDGSQADWVDVQVDRSTAGDNTVKTYSVEDCPLDTVQINAFLEEREIVSATSGYTTDDEHFHGYALYSPLSGSSDPSLTLTLSDTSPPWPYTSLWKSEPAAQGTSSIRMEAELSIDKDGVQYFFDCVTDPAFDSEWQESPKYTADGLNSNTSYSFRVKARDMSTGEFESNYSEIKSAITD